MRSLPVPAESVPGDSAQHALRSKLRQNLNPPPEIVVYDNFVRGRKEHLAEACRSPKVRIVDASILDRERLRRELRGIDGVFLLASLWRGECVAVDRI